jgi:hypothetical protein
MPTEMATAAIRAVIPILITKTGASQTIPRRRPKISVTKVTNAIASESFMCRILRDCANHLVRPIAGVNKNVLMFLRPVPISSLMKKQIAKILERLELIEARLDKISTTLWPPDPLNQLKITGWMHVPADKIGQRVPREEFECRTEPIEARLDKVTSTSLDPLTQLRIVGWQTAEQLGWQPPGCMLRYYRDPSVE